MRSNRFVTATDGTSLAWCRSGSGPPLVKTSTWLTHLDYDAESPVWAHQLAFYEANFDYLRYDERGCGLSDHQTGTLDLDTWVSDLDRVIEASGIPKPFTLMAMSQAAATAISYAARHPDNVARLVIIGGYARGHDRRNRPEEAALYHAIIEIFRQGFNDSNPAFRNVFASRFLPGAGPRRIGWLSDLCRRTTTPEAGAAILKARARVDATGDLAGISVPTTVFHAEDDAVVPISEGRLIAQAIPAAEFITLPSANHILQADEPAWQNYTQELLARCDITVPDDHGLTEREATILSLIAEAKSNKAIARDLGVSEKTVRNHATHIFAKLGVSTRAEAILKAKRP